MLKVLRKAVAILTDKISTTEILDNRTEREMDKMRLTLVENGVSVEVSEKIMASVKKELEGRKRVNHRRVLALTDASQLNDANTKKEEGGLVGSKDNLKRSPNPKIYSWLPTMG